MLQGLYNLTSGILTQNRNLNVISNNMVNISSPGYKKDTMVSTSFKDEMLYRADNKGKNTNQQLSNTSKIRSATETLVSHEQGAFEETGNPLDMALSQKGFFEIQTQGAVQYTRNGSFIIDEQGYLALPGIGRVMGQSGPIALNTDKITVDSDGSIRDMQDNLLGEIKVVDFDNYDNLQKTPSGMFVGGGAKVVNGGIIHKTLERSNVSMVSEMTSMMTSQRAIQSAAQIIKIYDQLMAKATTEIGRL
ncbi:MAG: flagellar hook-basal body protein [Peptostreptococcaceae bacterium]|nr:flagellar hook-basal body protein [Peptostreptococcaceae bacterium]